MYNTDEVPVVFFPARVEVRYRAVLPASVVPIGENEAGSSEGCTRVLCRFERHVQFSPSLIHMCTHRTFLGERSQCK